MTAETPLRSVLLLALALAFVAVAVDPHPAMAQGPIGGDAVILGRLYEKTATGTAVVGRFGLVASKRSPERMSRSIVNDPTGGLDCTVDWTAEIKGGVPALAWKVTWTGQTAGAGRAGRGKHGTLRLEPGMLGHVSLLATSERELFASVESGRASSFGHDKLARHFQTSYEPAPARQPVPRQHPVARVAAPTAPAAPAQRMSPAPMSQAGPGNDTLEVSFRLSRDGVLAFAPRVLVREGERFSVVGGEQLDVQESSGDRSYDGFEIGGSARRANGGCLVDFSVQTGRRLGDAGPATWLVDRYRSDVLVPTGREVDLQVFSDLEGRGVGRVSLALTCTSK